VKPIDIPKLRRGAEEALKVGAAAVRAGLPVSVFGLMIVTLAEQLQAALEEVAALRELVRKGGLH